MIGTARTRNRRWTAEALFAAGLLLMPAAAALAGPHDDARISGHLVDHSGVVTCPIAGWPLPPCSQFVIQGETFRPYDLYIVLARADSAAGVAGFDFAIDYRGTAGEGLDIFDWTSCADGVSATGNFPASGGSIQVTWNAPNCRRTVVEDEGVHVVAGAFYVYAYSDDTLILHAPGHETATITDCAGGASMLPDDLAVTTIAFGGTPPSGPCNGCLFLCQVTPVERATWGGIKQGYGFDGK